MFQKRIRDEIAAVEKKLESHNKQVEELTGRLEGLKRAGELFDSDQAAVAELLQVSLADGSHIVRHIATVSGSAR